MSNQVEVPLEFLQNNIGNKVWVVSRHETEFSGILDGFDDGLNVILSDMTEYNGSQVIVKRTKALIRRSEIDLIIPQVEGKSEK